MQDLHWYSQYWGYFFGYAIGDLMAAQIINSGLSKSIRNWQDVLAQGNFRPIKEWLGENCHKLGVQFDSVEMIEHITGEELSAQYFIDYITKKYSSLYQL
jgi:carboxypeptidase Taq